MPKGKFTWMDVVVCVAGLLALADIVLTEVFGCSWYCR